MHYYFKYMASNVFIFTFFLNNISVIWQQVTLKWKSKETKKGNCMACKIFFSFRVCSTCFNFTTYKMKIKCMDLWNHIHKKGTWTLDEYWYMLFVILVIQWRHLKDQMFKFYWCICLHYLYTLRAKQWFSIRRFFEVDS